MAARVTVYTRQALAEAYRLSTPRRVAIAHEMVASARGSAAVETGLWQSSYSVRADGERVFAINDDPAAVFIMFGTVDTPPHMELVRAGQRYGRYSGWQARG
ncbi:MAG: hypothetical protein K0Q93_2725 [Nocardioidaceae bacterium]|jgi:hypothetical protein|nr:hypothetical protein [Nocardioidaceae bacterium]